MENKPRIILPDRIFGVNVDEAMEKVLKEAEKPAPMQAPSNISSADISSTNDYWRIPGINYRNGIYTVDLAKTLLDSGNAKTQDDWAKYREQAIANDEFYTGDMPLYHSLFTALFKQKDKPESEEAREFIQKQMTKWFMTLTRIAYQPQGEDLVMHNYKTKDKYELKADIVDADRFIQAEDSKALEAIIGTGNVSEINSVYNWINQTPIYIWRLNKKPKKVEERVAGFVAGSGRADLLCNLVADNSLSSLGVRVCAQKI